MSLTLHTTVGDLKLELFCDHAPLACKNFLGLAAAGKYDGVIFHRSMPSFLIQGGDCTGTGKGGESIYDNKPFNDEISNKYSHDKRGMLAMANKNKQQNSNLSQFYIIYDKQPHLDGTNTIFGHVIDGFDTLDVMEMTEVDEKYRPLTEIAITSVTIHANPMAQQ